MVAEWEPTVPTRLSCSVHLHWAADRNYSLVSLLKLHHHHQSLVPVPCREGACSLKGNVDSNVYETLRERDIKAHSRGPRVGEMTQREVQKCWNLHFKLSNNCHRYAKDIKETEPEMDKHGRFNREGMNSDMQTRKNSIIQQLEQRNKESRTNRETQTRN